ncbi:MAG: hypothetical protein KKE44_00715 [Proteobacteria bacterium]|nr:hypothetical protein [Pseudomonadota bacterium]MBU1581249.1 hypothetical protein [Pseudomonadota bacterium]MBU2456031.1 hypothetical protein [Pseudomonadota bacterium]
MGDKMDTKESREVRLGRIGDRPYWVLIFSIFVRAIHQVGAAVFLGSFLLEDSMNMPQLYLIIVSVSGVILMITEGTRHRQLLRELSGVSTLIKLVLLGLAYHNWLPATPAILFSFVLASVFSHAPKSIRHRLLF